MKGLSFRFVLAAALMLATALVLQAHSRSEVFPPRLQLGSLPLKIDGWIGHNETLDEQSLDILGHPEYVLREYDNVDASGPYVSLFIPYYSSQRTGDTIHSPNHCLPGAGWVPTQRRTVELQRRDGSSFPVNRYVVSKGGDRQLVLYWFQAHGRAVASEYWAKYYLIADSIRMNRSDGALVRLMSPMVPGETPDAAQARMMKLGAQVLPMLDSYVPR